MMSGSRWCALLLMVCGVTVASSIQCYVSPSGTDSPSCGNYTTNACRSISGCVAVNASFVNLSPGNYSDEGNCDLTFYTPISVVAPSGGVWIVCNGSDSNVFTYMLMHSKGTPYYAAFQISGITFYNNAKNHFQGSGCIDIQRPSRNVTFSAFINNCTFIRWVASDGSSALGAAISNCYVTNNTQQVAIMINNTNFISNQGSDAGAVCMSGSRSFINNSNFEGNSGSWGGGVQLMNGAYNIQNSRFTGNHAQMGGAICSISNAYVSVGSASNLWIVGNSATNGGGIAVGYWLGTVVPTFLLQNSIIANNSAFISGGGMSIFADSVGMINVTITGNTATNGGGVWVGRVPEFGSWSWSNTSITNNTVTGDGGGLFLSDNGNYGRNRQYWFIFGLTIENNFNDTRVLNVGCYMPYGSLCSSLATSCTADSCSACDLTTSSCSGTGNNNETLCLGYPPIFCQHEGSCFHNSQGWACNCTAPWQGDTCTEYTDDSSPSTNFMLRKLGPFPMYSFLIIFVGCSLLGSLMKFIGKNTPSSPGTDPGYQPVPTNP